MRRILSKQELNSFSGKHSQKNDKLASKPELEKKHQTDESNDKNEIKTGRRPLKIRADKMTITTLSSSSSSSSLTISSFASTTSSTSDSSMISHVSQLTMDDSSSSSSSSSTNDIKKTYSDSSLDSIITSIQSKIDYFEARFSNGALRTHTENNKENTLRMAVKNRDRFMKRYSNPIKSNPTLRINDFALMCTLGRGSFGRVLLVHHKVSNKFYALKVLHKEKLVKNNQIKHTINERNILYACEHPNIIRLYSSFKDNSYLYFIVDLCCHSDLYTFLKKSKGFEENHARFYAANIYLALEYLHANQVVYRDLKPENILITSNGYLKLTDFGFAKRIDGTTSTMCGTPDYLSPEVLSQTPYGKSVDWWTFGIFIYELNTGKAPFAANEQNTLFEMIQKGSFMIPKKFTIHLSDICKQLIEIKVNKRLGCLKRESLDVKYHRWFDSIDWIKLYKQTAPAPYVPKAKEPLDIVHKTPNKPEEPLKISKINQFKKEFLDF